VKQLQVALTPAGIVTGFRHGGLLDNCGWVQFSRPRTLMGVTNAVKRKRRLKAAFL
jgi:hypothetical protein